MKTEFTATDLKRRQSGSALDNTPIHVGDIVYLQTVEGSDVMAEVIYNAPLDGATTYTSVALPRAMDGERRVRRTRYRFRHEHVHRIDPLRRCA
jgi:hypothetical protein